MDVFLGRNFVSGLRTLKPKKPKNLKNFLKNLDFFQPWLDLLFNVMQSAFPLSERTSHASGVDINGFHYSAW